MKRCVVIALIALVLIPASIAAQSVPAVVMDVTVPADAIGDNWTIAYEESSTGYPMPWDRQIIYGGPGGARVTVWVLGLGVGLEWVSGSWSRLTDFWVEEAIARTAVEDPKAASFRDDRERTIDSDLLIDSNVVELAGPITIGVAQYGAYDLQIGMLIVTEGTVNGLTGIAATDYIAGLYFAALSAQ